jgi:cyclohexyl-isocyanide hydratase
MLLFPGLTQLDLTGPFAVLTRVRGVSVDLAWKTLEPVTAASQSAAGLRLLPSCTLADVKWADLLFVPDGPGHIDLLTDEETLGFLRRVAGTVRYVTSVCTGSLVLGAAGLLRGYRATMHWASMEWLGPLGALAVEERVVIDRNRITGAGVTSGIDFGLRVIETLWGQRVAELARLSLEYDPAPPSRAGSPRGAPAELVRYAREALKPYTERQAAAIARAADGQWCR